MARTIPTARQAMIDRAARRLIAAVGYAVYSPAGIRRALEDEGWAGAAELTTAGYRRLLGDVQRAARRIYTDSLPRTWS